MTSKQGKFTLLVIGTLVLVVAAAGVVLTNKKATQGSGAEQELLFPALSARINDVGAITVTHKGETFSIRRGEKGWSVVERSDYPARTDKIRQVALGIAELEVMEKKTADTERLGELGLADPAVTASEDAVRVQLAAAAGEEPLADVVLGKTGQIPGTMYVRKAGENQSWLAKAKGSLGTLDVPRTVAGWLEEEIVHIGGDRMRRVAIQHPDGDLVVVERLSRDQMDYTLSNLPEGKKAKSQPEINALAEGLNHVYLSEVRQAVPETPGEKATTAAFRTFDGLELTVRLREQDGKQWVSFAANFNEELLPPEEAKAEAPAKDAEGNETPAADAAPKPSAREALIADGRKEAETLNARLSGWEFQLYDYKLGMLTKRMDDLVEKTGS